MIRWLAMLLGVFGTYRKNETVDVEYRSGGQVKLARTSRSASNPRVARRARLATRPARGAWRASPRSSAPTLARLRRKWRSCSQVKPMPPRTWSASLVTRQAASEARALAMCAASGSDSRLGAGAPGRVVGERARLLDVVEHPRAAGGRPPGRRRSGGRTAGAPSRSRRPSPSRAGRRPTSSAASATAADAGGLSHVAGERLAGGGARPARRRASRRSARAARSSPPIASTSRGSVVGSSPITAAPSASGTSRARLAVPAIEPRALAGGDAGKPAIALLVAGRRSRSRAPRSRSRGTGVGAHA